MEFNPHKTDSISIRQSRTPYLPQPPLTLCELDLEVSSSLKLLGVTIDDKLTFEKHIRNIASSIAQKTGLICKFYKTFGNNDAILKSIFQNKKKYLICLQQLPPYSKPIRSTINYK